MDAFTERLRERWDRIAPTRAFARRNRRRGLPYIEPETSVGLTDATTQSTSSTTYASARDTMSFTTTAIPSANYWWLRSPGATLVSERGGERVMPMYSYDLDTDEQTPWRTEYDNWRRQYEDWRTSMVRNTLTAVELDDAMRRLLSYDFVTDSTPKSKPCKMSGDFDKIFEGET